MARMETTITIRLDPKIEAFITQEEIGRAHV